MVRDPNVVVNFNGEPQMVSTREHLYVKTRTIFLNDEINSETSTCIITQLLFLDNESDDDITLVINSPGGSVSDGLAILDVMNSLNSNVITVCSGMCASMAAVLLSCGTKGKRKAYKNSEIMIHQPLGGIHGQASDIELTAKHILYIKDKINGILASNCSKDKEQVATDTDRDNWMSATAALEYGLIDMII